MSGQTTPPSPAPQHRRRSSFIEMFNPRPHSTTAVSSSPPSAITPANPNTTQHRRGTSITGLGLTTNASNQSPFSAFQRRASIATSTASSSPEFKNSFGDEPAVIEEDDPTPATMGQPPSPSFARRVSFGAQAMRDVKMGSSPGSATGGGRRPSSSLFTVVEKTNSENATLTPSRPSMSGPAKTTEGFNWSEALRDRSRRSPSFSSGNPFTQGGSRPRAVSNSNPEPPKEILKAVEPPAPVRMKRPDHLGERMLRGEFMMD
ncbi:hypothetical protein LTR99_002585 [Exophiala xenobiotica]|uniref:Uncharacterized protein n=1 Tax=Vermiconidia calcicola TaxID=1690605 RepID=A0AAV9QFP7_9PEZI|nr:hypothetical protein H2202_000963 [Exophiala xenobiotica]KAK5537143.1 hypothetical protein LTR23_007531 [Chaetothyriales sp. CCFEE 6169]KAK5542078.1 hypothetical protein LTR25_001963 [Vermiconidia calcicola]KAK5195174.1 hypothetical protein LTR92_005304 [Exophiala xenobiotica]KAK5209757.1 hypothetical protein LTR41_004389 [Exophiala xenobiotica]